MSPEDSIFGNHSQIFWFFFTVSEANFNSAFESGDLFRHEEYPSDIFFG